MWFAIDPDGVVHYLRRDLGDTPCVAPRYMRLSVERPVTCLLCIGYHAGLFEAIERLKKIKEEVKNWHKH